jgi:L-rhamnose mutarotase
MPAIHRRIQTGVKRFAMMALGKPEMLDQCREHFANSPPNVMESLRAANICNVSICLKKITSAGYLVLFNYLEYRGSDFQADMSKLAACEAFALWRKDCDACLVAATSSPAASWTQLEPLFYATGASDVAPLPSRYTRICMITGLKPEKEMEYRMLHATIWPGVLKSIKDSNIRNFSIYLGEVRGKLYLFCYMEYVGSDWAADDVRARALSVNRRWWKLTEACQEPLAKTSAEAQIWSAMEEVHHHQ